LGIVSITNEAQLQYRPTCCGRLRRVVRSSYDRALHALRTWLDSWAGIGHVTVGMHRQGYDLQLTQYDERGWRASWEKTSWRTVQGAARDVLRSRSDL
jgi:hypothetical protein